MKKIKQFLREIFAPKVEIHNYSNMSQTDMNKIMPDMSKAFKKMNEAFEEVEKALYKAKTK